MELRGGIAGAAAPVPRSQPLPRQARQTLMSLISPFRWSAAPPQVPWLAGSVDGRWRGPARGQRTGPMPHRQAPAARRPIPPRRRRVGIELASHRLHSRPSRMVCDAAGARNDILRGGIASRTDHRVKESESEQKHDGAQGTQRGVRRWEPLPGGRVRCPGREHRGAARRNRTMMEADLPGGSVPARHLPRRGRSLHASNAAERLALRGLPRALDRQAGIRLLGACMSMAILGPVGPQSLGRAAQRVARGVLGSRAQLCGQQHERASETQTFHPAPVPALGHAASRIDCARCYHEHCALSITFARCAQAWSQAAEDAATRRPAPRSPMCT